MEVWHILITLGICFFIIEIFTSGFISGSIGFGLLLTAVGNYFDLEIKWQILLFALGILLTYFFIRPFLRKFAYKNEVKTNNEALIGKEGKVNVEINQNKNEGRVLIDGDDWRAESVDNVIIKEGTMVKVVAVKSIVLIVKPLID